MIFKQHQQVMKGEKSQTRRLVKYGKDKPLPKTFRHSYYGDVEYRDVLMTYDACMFYEMKGVPFPGKGVYREWAVHYPGELGGRGDVDTFYQAKWIIGRTYAVQPGRGKNGIGYIRITDIGEERLRDISSRDCLAEGIREIPNQWGTPWYRCPVLDGEWKTRRGAFRALWNSIYISTESEFAANPRVWVLTFELA